MTTSFLVHYSFVTIPLDLTYSVRCWQLR